MRHIHVYAPVYVNVKHLYMYAICAFTNVYSALFNGEKWLHAGNGEAVVLSAVYWYV